MKVTSTSHRPFFSNKGSGGQLYFGMTGQVGGNFGLYANGTWVVSSVGIADGQWHHVAFTWDGTTRRLYLDGNPDLTDTTSVGAGGTYAANIGYDQPLNEYFAGSIDDVAVYSGVLSAAQVQTHFNGGRDFGLTLSESSPYEYVSASGTRSTTPRRARTRAASRPPRTRATAGAGSQAWRSRPCSARTRPRIRRVHSRPRTPGRTAPARAAPRP